VWRRTNRLAGVVALIATLGAAVATFQTDPDVVTQVSSPPTGLWIPAPSTGEIVGVDAASGDITARVVVGDPGPSSLSENRPAASSLSTERPAALR
jgi:hypothetical protein